MIKYIARRLGISVVVLLVGSFLLYFLTIFSGDPLADLRESNDPNRENLMNQRTLLMGLDKPPWERYFNWLGGAAKCLIGQCELGLDRQGIPVNSLVATAAANTLRLVLLATLLAIVIGIGLGVITAIRQYSGFDYGVTFFAFLCFSLPVFWFAHLLKHYAAIEFNNWIVTATFSWTTILLVAGVTAFILQAALGGRWQRRLATFAITAGVIIAAMWYFDLVQWFRRPALHLPVYILGVIGAAIIMIVLTSGFQNKRVRNSVAVTALVCIIGYSATRHIHMTNPSTMFLLISLLIAVVAAVVIAQLMGGFSRSQATTASVVLAIIASFIALADLMLSNWSKYLAVRSRPVPTVGAQTPNFESTYWNHFIDNATHLWLPTISLTLLSLAAYTRYTRASMLEVLNQDYIRTARSKGIAERRVITRHALRNGLIPIATIVAFDFAGLISGAVITESVFGWRGMGALFQQGLNQVDPNPVMAFFLVTGTAAVVMNLVADLTYAILDPRITR